MQKIINYSYLLLISLSLVACQQDAENLQGKNLRELRVGLAMQPASTLLIIAEEKGFFRNNGLNLKIQHYSSGKVALNDGLLAGEVDLISTSEVPFVLNIFEHETLKALTSIYLNDNSMSIIARRDHGIQFPIDLNNMRLATQKKSAVHYFMHQFIVDNGIDFSTLDISFCKPEELVEKLVNGEIDAFSMREPYISEAKEKLKDKVISFSEESISTQIGLVVSQESFLFKHRNDIKKFLIALNQAEQYFEKNKKESLTIVAKYIGADKKMFEASFGYAEARLFIDQRYINVSEDIARWAIKKEFVTSKKLPNYLQFIESGPLREVNPMAVTLIE